MISAEFRAGGVEVGEGDGEGDGEGVGVGVGRGVGAAGERGVVPLFADTGAA